jgi:hypothetical protein
MKSNKLILSLSILAIAGSMVFTSCKKRKAFKEEDGQTSIDNRDVQSENDMAATDVNDIVSTSALKGKGAGINGTFDAKGVSGNVTDATLDTTNISSGILVINFNGTAYKNRTRTGKIKLTLLNYPTTHWKDAGAQLKVEYINYKVTRISDGKFIILNGSQMIVNVSGTTWWDLLFTSAHSSIISEIKENGDLNVTFSDNKTAVYHINRRITYSWISGFDYQCKAEGIGSHESLNNLENYGTTRDGDAFTSQVTTPIVWNTACWWFAPVQGAVDIKVADKDFNLKVTFAVDKDGNLETATAAKPCAYGWKVEWKYKNKTKKKIFGYI